MNCTRSSIRKSFGWRLRQMHEGRGFNTRQFAKELGVEENTLSRWERSETEPSLEMLMHICQVLRITPNDLLLGPHQATDGEASRKKRPFLYIGEHIDAAGMTDQQVAKKLGHSRITVWRWRTNNRKLTVDRQIALAEVLGIEPEELWRPKPSFPRPRRSRRVLPREEPAASIIRKLGGPEIVARICGVHRTRPYAWRRPPDDNHNGTGGIIPHWYVEPLLTYANANGIELKPTDFIQARLVLRGAPPRRNPE